MVTTRRLSAGIAPAFDGIGLGARGLRAEPAAERVSQKADHRSRIGSGHKHHLQSVHFPDVMVAQNTPHSHHHDSHPKVQVLGFTVISAGTEFPASQADRFRV